MGVNGWETVVFPSGVAETSDRPLPLAIAHVLGEEHLLFTVVSVIGLFGLVASFHGIILAAGRATFEFGRVGFAPRLLGIVHSRFQTPVNALLVNMIIGILALLTGKTGEIITIACFGALSLYIISMISLLVLRKKEPDLERPFQVPFFPLSPIIALVIACVALLAITIYNPWLALIYVGILAICYLWFRLSYSESD